MINNAAALGVPRIVQPADITLANTKLNTVFVSYIFNTKHGLEDLTEEEYEAAKMLDDDIEGTRDERAYRFWINSLDIEDVYVNNLYEEARDGLLLLKVIHKLDPTIVDWKKTEKNPGTNKFKMGINCTEVIASAKRLGVVCAGIGG